MWPVAWRGTFRRRATERTHHPALKAIPHKSNEPRPELVACKSRIKELSAATAHLEALTPETLIAAQKEVTDCVFTEPGLSRDDLSGAYSIRDNTGKEAMRRITLAAEQQEKEFNTLRDHARAVAQAFLDGDKRYRALVSEVSTSSCQSRFR